MNWYDKINDSQRAKVLAFALGYLNGTKNRDELKVSVFHNQKYASKLLGVLEKEANFILLDQEDEGMDINDKITDWNNQLGQAYEYELFFDKETVKEIVREVEKQQEEIQRLNQVINKMDGRLIINGREIIQRENKRAEMQYLIDCYEKALKFYADENSYVTELAGMNIESTVMIDKGLMAKDALEKGKE